MRGITGTRVLWGACVRCGALVPMGDEIVSVRRRCCGVRDIPDLPGRKGRAVGVLIRGELGQRVDSVVERLEGGADLQQRAT